MNILHITSNDLEGGRFNGMSMVKSEKKDVDHQMFVWLAKSGLKNVHSIYNLVLRIVNHIFWRINFIFPLQGLFNPTLKCITKKKQFKESDVIHLHLVPGATLFNILRVKDITKQKPTVWTFHDMYPFTGNCYHSFDCDKWKYGCKGSCPNPAGYALLKKYFSRFHYRIKRMVYLESVIHIIVASKWMLNKVKESPLVSKFPVSVIPFGIDLNKFTVIPKKTAKHSLGIEPTTKVIAFRGINPKKDKYKGIRWLIESLNLLKPLEKTLLLIFDDGAYFEIFNNKYEILCLNYISEETELVKYLNASDIFLMPSIAESFGMMAVEAMACGTPVIAFKDTALEEIVSETELLVEYKNSDALANTINNILYLDDTRLTSLGQKARKRVEESYNFDKYYDSHTRLYYELINNNKKHEIN